MPGSVTSVTRDIAESQDLVHTQGLSLMRNKFGLMTKETLWRSISPLAIRLKGRIRTHSLSFKVVTSGERPLTRQLREAQKIANDIPSGQLINGRNEHIAPAFQQMAPTDILDRDRDNNRRTGR